MDILIREALVGDAEGILGVLNPIIETGKYTVLDTPFSVEEERDYIANFPERGILHVAERQADGKIVAMQTIEPLIDFTHALDHVAGIGTFVDLSMRRRGIGARLCEATFDAARRKGYEKIFTYVRADNAASLEFHEQHGFEVVGVAKRQARIRGQYIDEIFIEKFL